MTKFVTKTLPKVDGMSLNVSYLRYIRPQREMYYSEIALSKLRRLIGGLVF